MGRALAARAGPTLQRLQRRRVPRYSSSYNNSLVPPYSALILNTYSGTTGRLRCDDCSAPGSHLPPCIVTLTLWTVNLQAADSSWVYRTDPAEDLLPPVYRALSMSLERPDDVTVEVAYRGQSPRYAQLRYGTDDSTRVLVVVDEVKRNDVEVYVDTNRNRIIEPQDRVGGGEQIYRVALDVEMTEGIAPVYRGRIVLLHLGVLPDMVSVATCGSVAGVLEIEGNPVAVRRVDGDANGLFADSAARIWLDLDHNGRWSGVTEQFPFQPVLRVAERRFAVRADRLGEGCRWRKSWVQDNSRSSWTRSTSTPKSRSWR